MRGVRPLFSVFCLKSSDSSETNPRRARLDAGEDFLSSLSVILLSIGFSDDFCFGVVCSGVKGRLNSSVSFWESTLDAPQFTLDTFSYGYRLPFVSYPALCFLSNIRRLLGIPTLFFVLFLSFWTMAVSWSIVVSFLS